MLSSTALFHTTANNYTTLPEERVKNLIPQTLKKKNQTPTHPFLYSNYTENQGNTLHLCDHCPSQGLSGDQKTIQVPVRYQSSSLYQPTAALKLQVSQHRNVKVCCKLVLLGNSICFIPLVQFM